MNSLAFGVFFMSNYTNGQSQTCALPATKINKHWVLLFIFICLGVLSSLPLPLFAQTDPNANNTTGPSGSGNEAAEEKVTQLLQYVELLEKFGPRTMEQQFITSDFEEKLLKGIRDALVRVSNQFLSTIDTLNYVQTTISNNVYLRGLDFYRLDFGFEKDYYKELYKFNRVRHNYYFEFNLRFLYQIEEVIDDNSELLIQAFGQDSIFPIIYETKFFIGNILMFKGMTQYLDDAKERYEYILGKNPFNRDFVPNDELRVKIYEIMLDVYDRYFYNNYYHNTDYRKLLIYSREKLFYLWQLVDVNHEDQAIKDLKYRRLFTTYASIMDPNSENYKNLYSKYHKEGDPYPDFSIPKKYDDQGVLIEEEDTNDTTTDTAATDTAATDNADTTGEAGTQGAGQNNAAPAGQ